jgi:hypothetical protein
VESRDPRIISVIAFSWYWDLLPLRSCAPRFVDSLSVQRLFDTQTALSLARSWSILLPVIRGIIADYGAVIAVIIFTLVPYIPLWSSVPIVRINVPSSFGTTSGRDWFVNGMADLPIGFCFAAILPALVLVILIYFDHNVSSLLSQRSEFNLKKVRHTVI